MISRRVNNSGRASKGSSRASEVQRNLNEENLLVAEDLTRRKLSAMSAMSLDTSRMNVQNFRRRIPRRSFIRRKVLWQHGIILNMNQNPTLKESKPTLHRWPQWMMDQN